MGIFSEPTLGSIVPVKVREVISGRKVVDKALLGEPYFNQRVGEEHAANRTS